MQKRIEDLTREKNNLKSFPEREKKYHEDIKTLEIKLSESDQMQKLELQRQEKNFGIQRNNIEAHANSQIDQIKRESLTEAEKFIKQSEQTTKENNKLSSELELHQQELKMLQQERDEISRQNEQFKDNLQQNKEGLLEFQSINHKQAVKIKKLKEKIEYLSKFIEKEVAKQVEEIEQYRKKYEVISNDQEYELKGLNDQLRKKIKEIKYLKGLSQMILDQRSETEQYFLEAIDQVRLEVIQNKKRNQFDGTENSNSQGIKLPEIQNRSNQENSQQKSSKYLSNDRIEISQLDKENKDKIIKLVFNKMNSGIPPKLWRTNTDDNRNQSVHNLQIQIKNSINEDNELSKSNNQ